MSAESVGSLTSSVPLQAQVSPACFGAAEAASADAEPSRFRGSSPLASLPARDLVAIMLAGCGALLVFVSLLVDWQYVNVAGLSTARIGIADIPTWGTVYVVAALILIAVFVCVVALPVTFGPTARVLGISWAWGVAAVIVAMLVRLTGTPAVADSAALEAVLGGALDAQEIRVSWGAGILNAAIAVVLLMGAFVAACPPLRAGDGDRR